MRERYYFGSKPNDDKKIDNFCLVKIVACQHFDTQPIRLVSPTDRSPQSKSPAQICEQLSPKLNLDRVCGSRLLRNLNFIAGFFPARRKWGMRMQTLYVKRAEADGGKMRREREMDRVPVQQQHLRQVKQWTVERRDIFLSLRGGILFSHVASLFGPKHSITVIDIALNLSHRYENLTTDQTSSPASNLWGNDLWTRTIKSRCHKLWYLGSSSLQRDSAGCGCDTLYYCNGVSLAIHWLLLSPC